MLEPGDMLAIPMLPENVFDHLLGSLSLIEPSDSQNCISREIIPETRATDGARSVSEPVVRIWHRTDGDVTFTRFIERLKVELGHLKHKSNDAIAGSLIGLYALHPNRQSRPTSVLNEMLSKIVDGNLAQFHILSHDPYPGFQSFKVGEFAVGELKIRNLRNCSRSAGSDYFARYKESLIGRFAIERDTTPVKVLDWRTVQIVYDPATKSNSFRSFWNRGIEAYFGALAEAYFEDFWELLIETQHLLVACGAPYLDGRHLRSSPFANPVSVFFDINRSWGHVFPGFLGGFVIDFASVDRRIPETINRLRNEYEIDVGANLPSPLKNYALFMSKAKRYSDDGLQDESFLHYVIALELLFGERSRTAESVSKRVATLIFSPLGVSLSEAERRVDKLYDVRSQYVHAGRAVEPKLCVEVRQVCEEVLWALLRRLRLNFPKTDMLDKWTKDLDYLYSALIAGKTVVEADMRSSGILPGPAASLKD